MTNEEKKQDANKTIKEIRDLHDKITRKSFGLNLQEAIDESLTIHQSNLAKRAGVSRSVITNYLRGKTGPSLTATARMASVLRIDIAELTRSRAEVFEDEDIKKELKQLHKKSYEKSKQYVEDDDSEVRVLALGLRDAYGQIETSRKYAYNKGETFEKGTIKSGLNVTETRKIDDTETCKNQAPKTGLNKASADDSEDMLANIERAVEQSSQAGGYRLRTGDKETIIRIVKAYLGI